MTMATALPKGWSFRSLYACVDALRVAQGRILLFFGNDIVTKLE